MTPGVLHSEDSTLDGSGFVSKYYTRLKVSYSDKHSSLKLKMGSLIKIKFFGNLAVWRQN
jgi:hypothetical protein